MKQLRMFYLSDCPFCKKAEGFLKELVTENPEYGKMEIERIEESQHPEIADLMDYYFVPTYYMDGEKLHEGIITKEKLKEVLDKALEA